MPHAHTRPYAASIGFHGPFGGRGNVRRGSRLARTTSSARLPKAVFGETNKGAAGSPEKPKRRIRGSTNDRCKRRTNTSYPTSSTPGDTLLKKGREVTFGPQVQGLELFAPLGGLCSSDSPPCVLVDGVCLEIQTNGGESSGSKRTKRRGKRYRIAYIPMPALVVRMRASPPLQKIKQITLRGISAQTFAFLFFDQRCEMKT